MPAVQPLLAAAGRLAQAHLWWSDARCWAGNRRPDTGARCSGQGESNWMRIESGEKCSETERCSQHTRCLLYSALSTHAVSYRYTQSSLNLKNHIDPRCLAQAYHSLNTLLWARAPSVCTALRPGPQPPQTRDPEPTHRTCPDSGLCLERVNDFPAPSSCFPPSFPAFRHVTGIPFPRKSSVFLY